MKITTSIVAENEWSVSCTRDSDEDEGLFQSVNYDAVIAKTVAYALALTERNIADRKYLITCLVCEIVNGQDFLESSNRDSDSELERDAIKRELLYKLFLTASELKRHIEYCFMKKSSSKEVE